MLKLFGARTSAMGISANHFFSNSSITSLKSSFTSNSRFLKSNTQMLRSSMLSFTPLTQARSYTRSQTWIRYNRHYQRTPWDRLKRPALFTAAFCVATSFAVPALFDNTPLKALKRNPNLVVYGLIAINGGVFLAWRVPSLTRYMTKYALLVKDNIQSTWSMVGSAFSHQSPGHLLVNMFVLHSFGTTLCSMVGVANFTVMYLNSAVISSFLSLALPMLVGSGLGVSSLGASGAVFGVFGAFSYLIPKAPIALFFIPVPGGAWLLFLGSIAYNVAGGLLKWGRYDFAAHIGGSLAGIGYGWWFDKKRKEAMKNRRLRYGF